MSYDAPCVIVVFEGNNLGSFTNGDSYNQSCPFYTTLLADCHRAFSLELGSLSPEDIRRIGVVESDFQDPRWLLNSSNSHALAATLPKLLFQHALRYLSILTDPQSSLFSPHSRTVQGLNSRPIFLASSTGVLAAVAAATSSTVPEYLCQVVTCFRLAFWIGYRSGTYQLDKADSATALGEGAARSPIPTEISKFDENHDNSVVVTASQVINAEVFLDVSRRQISFPGMEDLRSPLHICTNIPMGEGELLGHVLHHLLSDPLDWEAGLHLTLNSIQGKNPVHIIRTGPNAELACGLEALLGLRQLKTITRLLPEDHSTCSAFGERIAIIGMALKMPGATGSDRLWQMVEGGVSSVMKVPLNRFNAPDYWEGNLPRRVLNVEEGNFLTDIENFDNEFFKISPREARMMDPQQRLLLHVAHEALEDAGFIRHSSFTSDPDYVGVFIGAATNDYVHNLREEIDIHYVSGTLPAFLSGRISHAFGLGGPSVVVDTACSSSGVALHSAVRALHNGDCKLALAGGVNAITCPDLFIGLDSGRFLSRSGKSAPFDSEADGYSRGEGCGLFVLKRLDEALLDNDRVLGVIRGIEVNQSYGNSSITRTHSPTQALLLRRLLDRAQVLPADVDVVEAHAAGTNQGDAAELEAIRDVFTGELSGRRAPLNVLSIKASIGHVEAASGAASVAKVLLMLRHKTIPRQIGIQTLNPVVAHIPSDQLSFPTKSTPWVRNESGKPRCAVVNNYGAAGSNVSILLEEYVDNGPHFGEEDASDFIFGMSAPNEVALEEMRTQYLAWLADPSTQVSLLDLCYTSTARRQQHKYRVAFSTPNDQREFLNQLTSSPVTNADSGETKVIFVYSGYGTQYPGMGSVLYDTCPVFKAHIDACDEILTAHGFPTVLPYLLGYANASIEEAGVVQQTSLLSFEMALTTLWKSWGISPSAVIGHSLGEYAALVAAGILPPKDALLLVGGRARLVQKHCAPNHSGMMSVTLTLDVINNILQSNPTLSDLVVACTNSRDRQTIAGPLSQLESLEIILQERGGVQSKLLSAAYAYHSPAMHPLLGDFERLMKDTVFIKPSLLCASTVTGSILSPSDVLNSAHLLRHCQDPVQFTKAIESLASLTHTPGDTVCWVEISPHRALLPLVRSTWPSNQPALFLDSMVRQASPWQVLTNSLSCLYTTCIDVKWKSVFSSLGRPKTISLPPYPFQSRPFWVQYRDPSFSTAAAPGTQRLSDPDSSFPTLTLLESPSTGNGHRTTLSLCGSHVVAYSRAHVVGSVPICPASVYLDAVLTGMPSGSNQLGRLSYYAIHQIEFIKPLIPGETGPSVTISLTRIDYFNYEFALNSQNGAGKQRLGPAGPLHCRGRCEVRDDGTTPDRFQLGLSCIQERIESLDPGANHTVDVFSSKSIYEVVFPRVVCYAKGLRSLERMVITEDRLEGFATMQLSPRNLPGSAAAIVNPVYLDAMVHFPGFVVNLQGNPDDLFVCVGIGLLEILPGSFATSGYPTYQLYTTISALTQDSFLAETVVLALDPPLIITRLKNIHFKRVPMHTFTSQVPVFHTPRSGEAHPPPPIPPYPKSILPLPVSSCPIPFRSILEDSLHIPQGRIREDSNLHSLGLDSLMSVEVLHTLQKRYHIVLPSGFLQEFITVGDVEVALERMTSPSTVPSSNCVEKLRNTMSNKSPICFIHDGTGLVSSYQKLLDVGRDVWAIKDPRVEDGGWESVEEMASFYADSLSDVLSGDVILAGWSFGGVIAYEVAKQLQGRGKPVKGIVLIDSPPPSKNVLLSEKLIKHILDNGTRRLPLSTTDTLQRQFRKNVGLMSRYRGSKLEKPVPSVFVRCVEGYPVPSGADVHEWFAARDDPGKTTAEWGALLGDKMKILDVPGHHFEMFRSIRIESTSKAVATACGYIEE